MRGGVVLCQRKIEKRGYVEGGKRRKVQKQKGMVDPGWLPSWVENRYTGEATSVKIH